MFDFLDEDRSDLLALVGLRRRKRFVHVMGPLTPAKAPQIPGMSSGSATPGKDIGLAKRKQAIERANAGTVDEPVEASPAARPKRRRG